MSSSGDMTLTLRFKADGQVEVVGAAKAVAAAVADAGSQAGAAGTRMAEGARAAVAAQREAAAQARAAAAAGQAQRQMAEQLAGAVDRLRGAFDPLYGAQQSIRAQMALVDQAWQAGAISAQLAGSMTDRLTQKLHELSPAGQAAAAAARQLAAAEEEAAAAQARAASEAAAQARAAAAAAAAQRQAAEQLAGAVDRVRGSLDPLYASQQSIRAQMALVDQAWQAGAISAQLAGSMTDRLTQELHELSPAGQAARAAAEQLAAAEEAAARAAQTEAAALLALKDRLDPLTAAERALWAEAQQVETWFRKGALSAEEYQHYLALLDRQMDRLPAQMAGAANGTKLAAWQITNLSYQIQDAAIMLASGQNPFVTLMQQGPQAAMALGGFGNVAKMLVSPIGLVTAGVAALAVPMAVVTARAMTLSGELRTLAGAAQAYNNSAISAAGLQAIAHAMAEQGKATRAEATATMALLVTYRSLSADTLRAIADAAAEFAIATGQGVTEAAAQLADAVKGGYEGVKKLDDAYGFLTVKQRAHIRELYAQGEATAAARLALDALAKQMQGAAATIESDWDRAMRDVRNAWNQALDDMAKSDKVQALLGVARQLAQGISDVSKRGLIPEPTLNEKWEDAVGNYQKALQERDKVKSGGWINGNNPFYIQQAEAKVQKWKTIVDDLQEQLLRQAAIEGALRAGPSPSSPRGAQDYRISEGMDLSQRYQSERKFVEELTASTDKYTAAMRGGRAEREKALVELEAETKAQQNSWTAGQKAAWIASELARRKADLAAAAGDVAAASAVETAAAAETAAAWQRSEAAGRAYEVVAEKLAAAHQSQAGRAWALALAQDELRQRYLKSAAEVTAYIGHLERQARQEEALAKAAGQGAAAEAEARNALAAEEAVQEQLLDLEAERVVLLDRRAAGLVSEAEYQRLLATIEAERKAIDEERAAIQERLNKITQTQQMANLKKLVAQQEEANALLEAELALTGATASERDRILARLQAENTLKAQGIDLSKELTAEQQALADAYLAAVDRNVVLQQKIEDVRAASELVKGIWADIRDGARDAAEGAEDAWKDALTSIMDRVQSLVDKWQEDQIANWFVNLTGYTSTVSSGASGGTASSGGTAATTSASGLSSYSNLFSGNSSSSLLSTSSLTSFATSDVGEFFGLSETVFLDDWGVASNASTLTSSGESFVSGMSSAGIGTSIAGMVGSIAGSYTASALFGDSEEVSLGSSLGGSVGSIAGAAIGSIIPGVGTAIGALIGSFLGSTAGGGLGSLFGDEEIPTGYAGYYVTSSGQVGISGQVAADGVDADTVSSMADGVMTAINTAIAAVDGNLSSDYASNLVIGYSEDSYFWSKDLNYYNDLGSTAQTGYATIDEATIAAIRDMLISGAAGTLDDNVTTALNTISTTDLETFLTQLEFAGNFDDILTSLQSGSLDYESYATSQAEAAVDANLETIRELQDLTEATGLSAEEMSASIKTAVLRSLGLVEDTYGEMTDAEVEYLTGAETIAKSFDLLTQAGYGAGQAVQIIGDALADFQADAISDYIEDATAATNELDGKSYVNDMADLAESYEAELRYTDLIGGGGDALRGLWVASLKDILSGADNPAAALQELLALYPEYTADLWDAYEALTAVDHAVEKGALTASINALDPGYSATLDDTLYALGVLPSSLGSVKDTLQTAWDSLEGGSADVATLTALVETLFTTAVDTGLLAVDDVEGIVSALIAQSEAYWDAQADLLSRNSDLVSRGYAALGQTYASTMAAFDHTAAVERYDFVAAGGDGGFFDMVSTVERLQAELGAYYDIIGSQIDASEAEVAASNSLAATLRTLDDTAAALRVDQSLSPGSAYTNMLEAESQYEAAKAKAKDASLPAEEREEAAAELDSLSRTYLTWALAFHGPSQAYAAIFARVQGDLVELSGTIATGLEDQAAIAQAQLDKLTELQAAIEGASAAEVMSVEDLTTAVESRLEALATAQTSLSSVIAGYAASVTSALSSMYSYTAASTTSAGSTTSGSPSTWEWSGITWDVAYNGDGTVTLSTADGAALTTDPSNLGIPGYEEGGVIENGTYGRDSVLARVRGGGAVWVAGGEFVMPTPQTERYLPILERMRAGTYLPGYEAGGVIAAPANDVIAAPHHWGADGLAATPANDRVPGDVGDLTRALERQAVAIEEQNELLRDMARQAGRIGEAAEGQRDRMADTLEAMAGRLSPAAGAARRRAGR